MEMIKTLMGFHALFMRVSLSEYKDSVTGSVCNTETSRLPVEDLMMLHQGGFETLELKQAHSEDIFLLNRLASLLMETIEEMDGKVIIWSRFRSDIARITEALKKKYGENAAGSYYGDTSDDDREKLVANFSDPEHETRFFIGNPQTAGYGLTLVSANNVIYYANDFNLETRVQSEDRCHRIGQTKAVTYVDLIAEGTVDEHIVKTLTNRINLAGAALGEEVRDWLKLDRI